MTGNSQKGIVLQERDRRLMSELGVMRVADREQARRVAAFGSVTRANCRLLALTRAGFLQRFFMGTGGGGKKAFYMLSPAGAKFVGVRATGPKRPPDGVVIADLFLSHQLLVNELYCGFKFGTDAPQGMRFRRWLSFSAPLDQSVRLIPDGYLEMEGPENSLAAFIEVDRAHERLAVWRGKVRNYLGYAVSGRFPEQFGRSRFLVLAVCESDGRTESLRATTAALTNKIFRFATFAAIRQGGLWSAVWRKPSGNEPHILVEAP